MRNNDQQLVDHLYNIIFVQKIRCDHFNSIGKYASNSVWDKYSDEKKILDIMIENYKNYYRNKVELLKTKFDDIKEININSLFTYDRDYYLNEYNDRIEEINKYLVELDSKSFNDISKDKLSFISTNIDNQFPGYLKDPLLLGML